MLETTAKPAAKPAATSAEETSKATGGDAGRRSGRPGDRRLSAGHRCPQAERHRHDLRPARHPDHRPHAQAAGGRAARDLVPARAERRVCRFHRRLHDAEAGHLPHGVRPRLSQRADGARQRHDQLLSDDPHQRLERARDRRPAAGRLRGDGPARHRQAARQGRVPRPARRGHRRRRGAGDPCGCLRPSGRRLSRPAGQAVPADDRRGERKEVADQGRRSGAAPDPGAGRRAARARSAEERQASAHHSRQGRGVRAGRCGHSRAGGEDRHPVPADVDGQGPAARHARAIRVRRALVRAAGSRRRDADRRALNWLLSHGKGKTWGGDSAKAWGGQKFVQIDISPQEADSNVRIDAPVVGDIGSCVVGDARRHRRRTGRSRPPSGSTPSPSARPRTSRRWGRRWRRIRRR